MTGAAPLLRIAGVSKSFRGLRALNDVSFDVAEREIAALIGPNGAGKTTLFNVIAGVFPPDSGTVRLGDADITGRRPDRICHAGIGRTFQLVKPFAQMTVLENVTVAALHGARGVAEARASARFFLELLELDTRAGQHAANLTLPDRKRLEVARALATGPRLLLLDEVMAGLRPSETDRMVATLRRLRDDTGLTILLIEHVMRAVMALSERIAVLHHGEKISEGTPDRIVRDPAVLECYLGDHEL
ncbi:MAG: ABC transporter ATP-binding protein [Defluviicoccus sp.]|nr:ABC transporter ATP-binding protein [Defluviicoccus sp.]MDE0278148.1 ABC transporter ATP-binding protein [Defluviicoccus sp.]